MTERRRRPIQLPLAFRPEDDEGQILPRGWRGWPTTITSTPKEPPPDAGDDPGRPVMKKRTRKKPAL